MSVPAKLADYEETRALLARLKVGELRKLAKQNNIRLEKKDWMDNVKPAKTKEEIIDVLVDSEFRESDMVILLGLLRLTNEELMHYMTTKQLRALARQKNIVLEKSTFLGSRKATRKDEIIDLLKTLPPSQIRRFGKKASLIQKKVDRKGAMKQKTKKRRKSKAEKAVKSIGLLDVKEHGKFIKVLNTTHAIRVLLALDKLQKPSTIHEIKDQMHQAKLWLDSAQLRYIIRKLEDLNVVKRDYESVGKRRICRFQATQDGEKFIIASKRFLQELWR